MKTKTITLLLTSVLTVSCIKPEYVDLVKLGSKQNEIILSGVAPGDSLFDIVSNRQYSANLSTGEEWCSLTSVESDKIRFSFTGNNGFRRSAKVIIKTDGRIDSMMIKQPGVVQEYIKLSSTVVSGPSEGASFSVEVSTNLMPRNLKLDISDEQCLKNVILKNNILTFDLAPSTKWDRRTYKITVYSVTGWEEKLSATLSIIQQPKKADQ